MRCLCVEQSASSSASYRGALLRGAFLLLIWYAHLPSGHAQIKREFRGVWIATVSNIDWPVNKLDAPGKQMSDINVLLDSLARVGFNAVVFQVRPSCDAFYSSSIEPWSEWLTGTQGVGPSPSYDPLVYMINVARAKGLEVHAWFNPYRAVVNTNTASIAANHVTQTHPEWILTFGTLKMLDPGLPEVRTYVTSVIMDVVRRYEIDGVHFDDYFYPYSGIKSEDSASYALHGGGTPLYDWRRENVNTLIKTLNDSIKAVKPLVKFGISPFGIWRNQASDPTGSATSGLESYSAIYADSRRWLQEGWVDYIAPQIYWRAGFSVANYNVLAPWWNANANSRHVYVGQGTYRMFNTDNWPAWEVTNQIALNRSLSNVLGSIHFSAKYFQRATYAGRRLNDSLRGLVYPHRVLRPTMPWKDAVPPNAPDSLTITKYSGFGLLKWKASEPASDGETASEYLMYRSSSLPVDLNDMSSVRFMGAATSWAEANPPPGQTVYFAITALDKSQNESGRSNIMGLTPTGTVGVPVESQTPGEFRLYQNFPNPFNPATVLAFDVGRETAVSLKVYDVLGREVAILWDGPVSAGYRQVPFDASGLPSGTYFYRLIADGRVKTMKMQVMR